MVALSLAGCADGSADTEPTVCLLEDLECQGKAPTLDDGTVGIRGVVVDDAIVPVEGATVRVVSAEAEATTDENGLFVLQNFEPGTYFLNISKLNFQSVQISAEAKEQPPLLKVQLARLFDQSPFIVAEQFSGFITCGYDVNFASSLCLNDYTRFVPGSDGVAPQLQETGLDDRDHDYEIENGWQTHIVEMVWEPSADSTSENMAGFISHFPRPATHRYAGGGGPTPVLIRMQQGEVHENSQDEPNMVPPEGLPNMHFFAAVDTDASQGPPFSVVAVAIEQDFEAFFHTFYHGIPPEEWSFIRGDGNPF